MKLSILILTHNRPKLLNRLLSSIFNNFDKKLEFEILINNDSDLLDEYLYNIPSSINHTLYFFKNNNLGQLYFELFKRAKGEFIWFLEDDDYLKNDIFNKLSFTNDIMYCNYHAYDPKLAISQYKSFEIETINNHFQFSQIIFRKKLLKLTEFPLNNNLDNDWNIFQIIRNKTKDILIIKSLIFYQTCDGKDNISFPQFNKDNRWPN